MMFPTVDVLVYLRLNCLFKNLLPVIWYNYDVCT